MRVGHNNCFGGEASAFQVFFANFANFAYFVGKIPGG